MKAQGVQSTAGQLKGLDAAGRNAGKGMGVAEKSAKRSSKTFSVLGSAAKSAGLLVGAAGLAGGLKFAVSEFREAQKVGAQTSAVLKSTGRQAGVTKKHIESLAGAISKKTGIDDEAIQASENLLLTFTKVRNETGRGNKVFDRATQTVTDMSVALGQSAKSSAIQLGKALNDPIKGITALRRVGVSFTADQEKQIKKMVESGDLLGAQRKILKELGTEFAGSAAAQATAGDKLKVSLGNLAEVAGSFLVPMLDKAARALTNLINDFVEGQGIAKVIIPIFFQVRDAVASMIPSVMLSVDWFKRHQAVAVALAAALGLVVAPLATLAIGFAAAYASSQGFRDGIATAATAVAGFPAVVMTAVNAVVGAFNSMKAFVAGVMNSVTVEVGKWKVAAAIVTAAIAVIKVNMGILAAVVGTALAPLAPLFRGTFNVIKAIVTGAFSAIKAIVSGGLQALRGVVQIFGGILKGDFNQIWEGVKNVFRGVGKALVGILTAQVHTVIDAAKAIGTAIVNGIVEGIKAAAGKVTGAVKGAVKDAAKGAAGLLGSVNPFGDGLGFKPIVPMKGGGSLMGARPSMAPFAAVGAANGLRVSSGLRGGATTSSGNTSYHSTGEAVDLAGSPAGMMKTFRTLRSKFGSRLAELIHTPGGAGIKDGRPYVYTGKVAADHFDHVHVAFDTGMPGVGDGPGRVRRHLMGDGYGKTQLQSLWTRAGGPAGAANLAAAVALAESGGQSTASNRNSNGTIDRGLWQINSIHGKKSTFNPLANAKAAVSISSGGRNWNPWVAFKNGAYKKFLGGSSKVAGKAGKSGSTLKAIGKPSFGSGAGLGPSEQQIAEINAQADFNAARKAGAAGTGGGEGGAEGDPNQPLIDAINAMAARIAEQIALESTIRDEQRRFANVSGSNYAALAKAISDVASGQIGGKVGLGFMSPSFPGGGSRY